MADYADFELNGMRIRTRPTGWRRWVPLMRKWPYFTGSQPRFTVMVEAAKEDASLASNLQVRLETSYILPDKHTRESGSTQFEDLKSQRQLSLETPWLTQTGQHLYRTSIIFSDRKEGVTNPVGLVVFDVKSSDSLILVLAAIVASGIVTAMVTVGGGLLVGNALKEDFPDPVVVVEATKTALPSTLPSTR